MRRPRPSRPVPTPRHRYEQRRPADTGQWERVLARGRRTTPVAWRALRWTWRAVVTVLDRLTSSWMTLVLLLLVAAVAISTLVD